MSKPQIQWLSGEEVIATKLCNAKIDAAEPNVFFHLLPLPLGPGAVIGTRAGMELAKQIAGGTWVGGKAYLTSLRVVFEPNALNVALQNGVGAIALSLEDLTEIRTRRGVLTSIVEIRTTRGALSIRLFGAKQFADIVNSARKQFM